MSDGKINLEELFDNNFDCYTEYGTEWECIDEQPALTKEKFKELCIVFGKQLLKLAADDAKVVVDTCMGHKTGDTWVDEDSILNTINQIK